ncbi:MAG: hypothetical protein RR764_09345 [Oscillospiraceae bacterium]
MNFLTKFIPIALVTNPNGFFDSVKGTAMAWITAAVDKLLIPVGVAACGGFFIFLLIKCASDYNEGRGNEMKPKIMTMLLIIIIAALLLSKNLWWNFVFAG